MRSHVGFASENLKLSDDRFNRWTVIPLCTFEDAEPDHHRDLRKSRASRTWIDRKHTAPVTKLPI